MNGVNFSVANLKRVCQRRSSTNLENNIAIDRKLSIAIKNE